MNNVIGQMSELQVALKLSQAGYEISIPFSSYSYDLVCIKNETVLKVQVKTVGKRGGHAGWKITIGNETNKYSAGSYDLMLAYCAITDRVYNIPFEEIAGKHSLSLSDSKLEKFEYVIE